VSRHFSEFPTFSISAETLVNTRERKEKSVRVLRTESLPKCEIMYKTRMNNDSAVIHCDGDALPWLPLSDTLHCRNVYVHVYVYTYICLISIDISILSNDHARKTALGLRNSILQSKLSNRYDSNHFYHKTSTPDIIIAKIAIKNRNKFNLFLIFILLSRIIR